MDKTPKRQAPIRKVGKLAGTLALVGKASFAIAGCNQSGGGPVSVAPDSTGGGGGAVVTVNDQPIERNALYTHMEANYGENSLRQLIDFALITQKLKAEGLSVSEAEVDAAIQQRKDSSPEVAQILETGGVRLNALKRQTRYQLSLDKLLTKDVKVTDDQLKKWFETRRKYYDQPAKAKVGILLTSTKARADTMAAQLKSKSKSFLELVEEQKKAKDPAGAASLAETPTLISTEGLPPLLKNTIDKLKTGENSGVVEMKEGPQTAYAILRAVQKQPAVKADFAKLKPQLEMDYKLEQVARNLNKENPSNPPFDQALDQVAAAVAQQSGGQPTFREILTFITQTAATNLTTKLRSEAKIVANDKTYDKLVEGYKPPETATPAGNTAPAGNAAPATP
jgi:foldase protein PrsA